MSKVTKAVAVAVGASALALGVSAPAGAYTTDDPCQLAVTFLCQFVPIAPNLDHDIDLTEGPATLAGHPVPQMPSAPDPVYGPPADVCANGCI
ncbi:MAG: fibronectin-binding protein [Actinomycetia bacterium]|nr:fibronectin-binding protein [Actinomycetes bacterium]